MSATNGDAVRTFYGHFLAGKFEEAAAMLTDDFVLTNPLPEPIPFGGRFEGSGGFLAYLGSFGGTLEIREFSLDEVICDGERVVVTGRERSRVISTDREYTMEWVHVLGVRDGRIASLREYNDTSAMRDAFEPAS